MKADSINHQVHLFPEFCTQALEAVLETYSLQQLQRLKTLMMKLTRSATCTVVFSFVYLNILIYPPVLKFSSVKYLRDSPTLPCTTIFAVTLLSLAWPCCATLSPIPCTVSTTLQLPSSCDIITRVNLPLLCTCYVNDFACVMYPVCFAKIDMLMESCWQETDTYGRIQYPLGPRSGSLQ